MTSSLIHDTQLADGTSDVGLRWDGDVLVTAVELLPQPNVPTVLADGVAVTEDVIPLKVVADCLWQFDINLLGIDVASEGRRVVAGTAYARSYDQLISVRPGVIARRTWLILRLRFDPDDLGIRNRGGGVEGAIAAAMSATRRAARRLREENCGAVVADADSLQDAHAALSAGLGPEDTKIERGTLATPNRFVTTYRVHPDDVTNLNLGTWWAHRSVSTAVIIRLTPDRRPGRVHMRTWVRYVTAARPDRSDRLPGLIRQYGDQAEALTATMPLGEASWKAQQRIVSSPRAVRDIADLGDLQLPVGPGGQLIGSTPTNHPFLLPLTEPDTLTRIYVDAELWVAQQLVLRALPSGATTRVTSSRPEQWWPMMRSLAEPRRLWLSQTDRLTRSETARVATVQVCDHCPVSYPSGARTLLMIGTNNKEMEDQADVVLRQRRGGLHADVWIDGRKRPVRLSVTKEETRYLGRLDD